MITKLTEGKVKKEGFEGRDWSVKRVTFEVAVKDKDLSKFSGSAIGAGRGLFGSLGKVLEANGMILMGDMLDVSDADTKAYIDNEMISDEDFEGLGESAKLTESTEFFSKVDKIVDDIENLEEPLDVGEVDKGIDALVKIKGAVRAKLIGIKTVLSDMKKELGADAGDDVDDVIAKIDNLF